VGANGALVLAPRTQSTRAYAPKRIASLATLAAGDARLFRYPTDDDPCLLIRKASGVLVAFSQVCTHLSCAVVYRREDERLFCPCHNGLFDCREGESGAQPLEGPPERPLPRILLEVRGDDVFATGVAA
jgi:Rieske Fe-S protein